MSDREPDPAAAPVASADGGVAPGVRQYEPAPGVGRLLIWVLLFVLAAVAVVLGGVYFT
ncbi:hypothetical protein [Streptomyces asoensis]|uniref:Uncharacterized protein n=1 Tax=Streptomyces asoensis TaxID=249586 RepID=A0ABQ3RZU5_9ACTN|nr:hypothetical protein [Streptomyces asoensis]GGQ50586.1 hypothetical protein GCM10010496_11450 [Streptomyces asoensis]GHI61336.1 hypothetical protein Saso_29860 [Streptomyces asoensis]